MDKRRKKEEAANDPCHPFIEVGMRT